MSIDSLQRTAPAGGSDASSSGARSEIEVGDAIGRFVALRPLGEGAMGVVYAGYDVQLDRKVALKLTRAELISDAIRERSLREAQALAKLSHPNVVQVYEAGRHQQRLFVAMEYIDGLDLRRWLEVAPRPWRAVLATICAAGRGLAAAHAIGLVHRDVKPDNILVGADGRARIADFGLVSTTAEDEQARAPRRTDHVIGAMRRDPSGSQSDLKLTQEGRSIGTPAYMAPEQHRGRGIDARSDQFSFCVTLYEGLHGVRPFTGTKLEVLRDQVEHAQISPPPAGSTVPRWIHRLLVRGLQPAPKDRWPSMDVLLDALADDPQRRRRTITGIAMATALIGGGAYALADARAEDALRCQGAARELEGVWDADRSAALARAWDTKDGTLAAETRPRVTLLLDTYAQSWTEQHNRSCEAHRRGEASPLLLDRTMACLKRRHQALAALVDVLGEADDGTIANAVQAAASLPRIDYCADPEALLAAVPLPEDPARAAEVEAIRGELARAVALESAGRNAEGLALVDGLKLRVEAVDYPPLVAELHLQRGRLNMLGVRFQAAGIELKEAFVLGLGARADEIAAEALVRWIFASGYGLNQPQEALRWEPIARAMIRRLSKPEELAALLAHNTGPVLETLGDLERATTVEREALAGWTRTIGRDHPQTIYALHNLVQVLLQQGQCAEGRQLMVNALPGIEATLGGSHPLLPLFRSNRCIAYECAGERDAATECFDAIIGPSRELPTIGVATILLDRASMRLDGGDIDGAQTDFLGAREQDAEPWPGDSQALVGLARIDLGRGDIDRAQERYQTAIDTLDRHAVPEHLRIPALAGIGEVLLARGDILAARTHLEATLRFAETRTKYPWLQAPARFALALALAAGPAPDHARARVLAREAEEGYAAGGHYHDGERARIALFLVEVEHSDQRP